MPTYSREDDVYFVSLITGPTHTLLGLKFGDVGSEIEMIALPPRGDCKHEPLDIDQIKRAVFAGVSHACAATGADYHVARIHYVTNDTPTYGNYMRCAELIVRRLVDHGEFVSR